MIIRIGGLETTNSGSITVDGDVTNIGGDLTPILALLSIAGALDTTSGNLLTRGGYIDIGGTVNDYAGSIIVNYGSGYISLGGNTANYDGEISTNTGNIDINGTLDNTNGGVEAEGCTHHGIPDVMVGFTQQELTSASCDIDIASTTNNQDGINSEVAGSGNIAIGGDVTSRQSGDVESYTGDIDIYGNVTQTLGGEITNDNGGDIHLHSNLSNDDGSDVTAFSNLTIDGTVLNQLHSAIYNFGDTGDVDIGGSTTNESGSQIYVYTNTGNMNFGSDVNNAEGGIIDTQATGGQINVTGDFTNSTADDTFGTSALYGTDGDWNFAGSFSNDGSSNVQAPTGTWYIGQDFSNAVTNTDINTNPYFDANNGTITFNGSGNSNINGSTTFYNFAAVPGKTLTFQAGTSQIINGDFNLTGAAGNLINIVSSASPTQASVDPESTLNVSYVNVQDNVNLSTIYNYIDPTDSVDGGHTVRWFSTHVIAATTQGNGSIDPSGTVIVNDQTDQSFNIAPASGNVISNVLVDGVGIGAISSYSFNNVEGPHTIVAIFSLISSPAPVVPAPITKPPVKTPTPPAPTTTTTTTTVTPTTTTSPTTPYVNENTPSPQTTVKAPAVSKPAKSFPGYHYLLTIFSHVPAPIANGFPWLLLFLLLLMVLWSIRQAWRETKYARAREALLKQMQQLAEAKNIFLDLATHYIRTPYAKLSGGVELLSSLSPNLAVLPKLKELTNQLKTTVEYVVQTVTDNKSVKAIVLPSEKVKAEIHVKLANRLWLITGFIGVLGFLIDALIRNAKHLHTSTIVYATQAALYVLLGMVLYGTLRIYRLQHQRRTNTDTQFTQQQASMPAG